MVGKPLPSTLARRHSRFAMLIKVPSKKRKLMFENSPATLKRSLKPRSHQMRNFL
jgi:hypothetical protein